MTCPTLYLFAESTHNIWRRGSDRHCRVDHSAPDLPRGFQSHLRIRIAGHVNGEPHADRLWDITSNRELELMVRERGDQLILIELVINPPLVDSPTIRRGQDDVRQLVFHKSFRYQALLLLR